MMPSKEWPQSRTLTTPNAEENLEWQELSFSVGENTRWCNYFEKQYTSYTDNIILLWLWVFVFLSVYTQRHKFMNKNKIGNWNPSEIIIAD